MTVPAKQASAVDFLGASFGERLRYQRQLKKMTIEGLACLMSTNTSQIWRLEGKTANPRLDTVQKLCTVLEVPINQLLPSNQVSGCEDEKYIEFYRSSSDDMKKKIRAISYLC